MANHWGIRGIADKGIVQIDALIRTIVATDLREKEPEATIELTIHEDDAEAFWHDRYYEITIGEASVDLWLTEEGNLEGRHGSPWEVHWWATDILGRRIAMGLDGTYWDNGVGDLEVGEDDDILHLSYDEYMKQTRSFLQRHLTRMIYGHRS